MDKLEHITRIGQRVRLKADGQDSMYVSACAGSEGWVRDQEKDNHGYPMVYIEWDKDHWSYNGEADRWAFESHFDPVEEKMSDEINEQELAEFREFQKFKQMKAQEGSPEAPEAPQEVDPERLTAEQYAEIADRAAEMAKDADAFVLIAVDRHVREDSPVPAFVPAMLVACRSPESGMIAELQLAKYTAAAFEGLTVDAIKRKLQDES